jgi:hypothetical protein
LERRRRKKACGLKEEKKGRTGLRVVEEKGEDSCADHEKEL